MLRADVKRLARGSQCTVDSEGDRRGRRGDDRTGARNATQVLYKSNNRTQDDLFPDVFVACRGVVCCTRGETRLCRSGWFHLGRWVGLLARYEPSVPQSPLVSAWAVARVVVVYE